MSRREEDFELTGRAEERDEIYGYDAPSSGPPSLRGRLVYVWRPVERRLGPGIIISQDLQKELYLRRT